MSGGQSVPETQGCSASVAGTIHTQKDRTGPALAALAPGGSSPLICCNQRTTKDTLVRSTQPRHSWKQMPLALWRRRRESQTRAILPHKFPKSKLASPICPWLVSDSHSRLESRSYTGHPQCGPGRSRGCHNGYDMGLHAQCTAKAGSHRACCVTKAAGLAPFTVFLLCPICETRSQGPRKEGVQTI